MPQLGSSWKVCTGGFPSLPSKGTLRGSDKTLFSYSPPSAWRLQDFFLDPPPPSPSPPPPQSHSVSTAAPPLQAATAPKCPVPGPRPGRAQKQLCVWQYNRTTPIGGDRTQMSAGLAGESAELKSIMISVSKFSEIFGIANQ